MDETTRPCFRQRPFITGIEESSLNKPTDPGAVHMKPFQKGDTVYVVKEAMSIEPSLAQNHFPSRLTGSRTAWLMSIRAGHGGQMAYNAVRGTLFLRGMIAI
jgi:hypothetical protein